MVAIASYVIGELPKDSSQLLPLVIHRCDHERRPLPPALPSILPLPLPLSV
jgi:hypothetical protein